MSCLINGMGALTDTPSQTSRNDTIWQGVPANDVPLCVAWIYPGIRGSPNINGGTITMNYQGTVDTAGEVSVAAHHECPWITTAEEDGAGTVEIVEYAACQPAVFGRWFI